MPLAVWFIAWRVMASFLKPSKGFKTNKVPHHATLLTGALSAISAGIFSLANMASLVNIATLAYLVLLAIPHYSS